MGWIWPSDVFHLACAVKKTTETAFKNWEVSQISRFVALLVGTPESASCWLPPTSTLPQRMRMPNRWAASPCPGPLGLYRCLICESVTKQEEKILSRKNSLRLGEWASSNLGEGKEKEGKDSSYSRKQRPCELFPGWKAAWKNCLYSFLSLRWDRKKKKGGIVRKGQH